MPKLSGFLEKFLYSNLIIAGAAAFYTSEYYLVFGREFNWHYLWFVCFVSLAHYNLHRLVGLLLDHPIPYNERLDAIERNTLLQGVFLAIGGTGASYLFISQSWFKEPVFYLPVALGLLYTLPIIGIRLRDIAFFKTFFIGATWMAVAVFIPAVLDQRTEQGLWLYAFEKFSFIVAITFPFDLRDIQRDLHTETRTIANQFGYRTVMEWCAIFFVISQFCHYQLFLLHVYNKITALTLIVFNALCYIIILIGCRKPRKDVFYLGILDGLIVIQGVIYLLLYNMST
ncbi:MAG TPA: hypothetical protein VJ917_09040 [Saprospiraceae bacterium]|nr:hypothetical protein [Saprospiraceae bacterium]